MKKIALMPGHASYAEGSKVCAGKYKDWGEHKFACLYLPRLAAELQALGYDVVCTSREEAGGSTPSYSAKAANAAGVDIALEFHFNSCGNATGTEVMYWGKSATGKQFATLLGESVAARLGVRHRGAKYVPTPENRGTEAFRQSRMPFFMVEFCFAGSNPEEAEILCRAVAAPDWETWLAGAIDTAIRQVY